MSSTTPSVPSRLPQQACSCTKEELQAAYPDLKISDCCPECDSVGVKVRISFHHSESGWSPRLVGVELNPGPCQGAVSEGKCEQGCTLTPEQVKGFKPDGICDCGHSYLRHGVLTVQSTGTPSQALILQVQAMLQQEMQPITMQMQRMQQEMQPITSALNHFLCQTLDPWEKTSHSRSHAAAQGLSDGVLQYYGFNGDHRRCHLVGKVKHSRDGDADVVVTTAHIWPNHTRGIELPLFGLNVNDLNHPRNFLRLHEQVEKAFDHRELTIVLDGGHLSAYVLNPSLLDKSIKGTWNRAHHRPYIFRDFHNTPLTFLNDERPYHRLLAAHAAKSFQFAEEQGWIEPREATTGELNAKELARYSLDEAARARIDRWLFSRRSRTPEEEANKAEHDESVTTTTTSAPASSLPSPPSAFPTATSSTSSSVSSSSTASSSQPSPVTDPMSSVGGEAAPRQTLRYAGDGSRWRGRRWKRVSQHPQQG